MTEDTLLEKFAELLLSNNQKLLQSVEKSTAKTIEEAIKTSEKRIKQEIIEEVSKKIDASQRDTIDTLTALIHTGYNLHEVRIQRLEDELNLPPLKQNTR